MAKLEEIFETFPRARMNIEIKQLFPSVVRRLAEMIVHHKMEDRVLVGSFYYSALRKFRALCPRVATSASAFELAKFVVLRGRGVEGIDALQVRPKFKLTKVPVITEGFVRMARERGLPVHAWTVNDKAEMERLRGLKIDGIITDYPGRLLEVLKHGDGVGGGGAG